MSSGCAQTGMFGLAVSDATSKLKSLTLNSCNQIHNIYLKYRLPVDLNREAIRLR